MQTSRTIKQGNIWPRGISAYRDGINVALQIPRGDSCGIYLWTKSEDGKEEKETIPFCDSFRVGDMSCMYIPDVDPASCRYQIFADKKLCKDVYATKVFGTEKWGREYRQKEISYGVCMEQFDWEDDRPLKTPYEDSILYCMHVRGFTKHSSSGVKHRGTFAGMIEKIPYLKQLGITAVELMPAYDFAENDVPEEVRDNGKLSMEEVAKQYALGTTATAKKDTRLNYWGYAKNGHFFVPKASYASEPKCAETEFKTLVKELHKNGIELIMHFYFEKQNPGFILEVLKYWRTQYHVDGFHLKGQDIPLMLLATEEILKDCKLLYYHFPYENIYGEEERPSYRNLASYRDDFMYDMRRYLKGDENMLPTVLGHLRHNSEQHGVVQYMTNYFGFTLFDMVSYERKHNLDNGEENRDGNDLNFSWNCGAEGVSRKKNVLTLRKKQLRNAMNLLFLSQGTPAFFAGDEFGNTQKGNNNPYCQDNDISWLNWNLLKKNEEWFCYVKSIIAFRKNHAVLRGERPLKLMDTLGCGFPDVSYHGSQAWRADLQPYNRHVGILYAGNYRKDDDTLFVGYNMYWEKVKLALPKLLKGKKWYLLSDTAKEQPVMDTDSIEKTEAVEGMEIELSPRTIAIYVAK